MPTQRGGKCKASSKTHETVKWLLLRDCVIGCIGMKAATGAERRGESRISAACFSRQSPADAEPRCCSLHKCIVQANTSSTLSITKIVYEDQESQTPFVA